MSSVGQYEMKRDMDLLRLLLLRSEGDESAEKELEKYEVDLRAKHVQLLIDANLVEGIALRDEDNEIVASCVSRITWLGYDFLDATRDATVWSKAKDKVLKPGASWTFELLKEWLKAELKQRMGI